jgi:glycosyltransferase involved in cell wall biosynthesis
MPSKIPSKFARKEPISLLSVLVPVFNEERVVVQSLLKLHSTLETLHCSYEIIIVESNSTDSTRKLVQDIQSQISAILLLEDFPKGKGHAVRKAMQIMRGDVFLIFDADLEYDPIDIPKLIEPIEKGLTAFVLGTRHKRGQQIRKIESIPVRAYIMNLAHRFFVNLLNRSLGTSMTDPFTMYKLFRREVFSEVELRSNRFDFDWELVIKAVRRGAFPVEISVEYSSRSFKDGKKVRFFRDPITWLIALLRYRYVDDL